MTDDDAKPGRDEGFLARWSRLKQEDRETARARPESETDDRPSAGKTVAARDARTPAASDRSTEDQPARKPIDLAELPSLDSLSATSDYAPFMREGVPEELRRQALRKLWMSDPVLSAPDPYDLHAFDYNIVPTFPQGLANVARAGLGMLQPEDQARPGHGETGVETAAAGSTDSPPPQSSEGASASAREAGIAVSQAAAEGKDQGAATGSNQHDPRPEPETNGSS